MGKKEKKFIALSEVDHKLQFINVIAVIGDITPTICRSKLTKIELHLLDETVKRPGFNVKLNMESKMLNQFLNAAKIGFIIQLNDIKITKNEGEVYGEVQEEEEVTLYNDSPRTHKWYPGENTTEVTDTVKLKILSMLKWKKANFKDNVVFQENDESKSKTRRSGLNSDGKSQSSNSLNKISTNDVSTVLSIRAQKITANNQQVINNLSASKENKLKETTSRRSKLELSTPINKPTKHLRANKTLVSCEEAESPSTNSSIASISSSSPSRVTRAANASNLSKSSSLSSLNKSKTSRTLKKSLSLSRLIKSDICKRNKSVSLSRLNKSQSQTNLDDSKVFSSRKEVTKDIEAKGDNSESESLKTVRLTRSISTSKVKKITSSSDSDVDEINSEKRSLETHACSFSSINRKPDKENNKGKDKSRLDQTQSSASNKNKGISVINNSRKTSRNKTADYIDVKNNPANKEQSKCFDSKTEKVIPVSKSPQNNQKDCVPRDTEKIITTVKLKETKINRNKKYCAGILDDKLETSVTNNLESNCKVITKAKGKETEKESINEEKFKTFETLKRTRQTIKNKTERSGSPSLSKTDSPVITDSNCSSPNTSSKLSKSQYNTSREFIKRKPILVGETELNNQLGKNSHNRNSKTKRADSGTNTPTRKKTRLTSLTYGSGHSSDSSSAPASPKSKRKQSSLVKIPTLNSSDSTLSECSNPSVNKVCSSRESPCMQKRDFTQIDVSSELVSVPIKKFKLDQETVANKNEDSRPTLENDLSNQVNEQTRKSTEASETISKDKSNRNNNDNVSNIVLSKSNKHNNSEPDFKSNQNEIRKDEKNKDLRKTTRLYKKDNNTVKNNRESGKGGIYETYLRPFTKKLNFISVENITDISLCDLEEVYVPEKFDLHCKVISEFVLVEEGIQVARVQDGTICKCGTLKIPLGNSWDVVSKEILDSPIVEEKSPYIDIIIFNYFRLDFPIKSGMFFQINNIMAVKFQLKQDPRQRKKSLSEFFFCVEGQNANIKKLKSQQIKVLLERITVEPQKSTLPATINDKATTEKPASDLSSFKLPSSPKVGGKSILSTDKKSPMKTKHVTEESGSGLKLKTRKLNDTDSDIDPEVTSPRGRFPAEDKMEKVNLKKNSETCKGKVNIYENLEPKINTSSSDETMMGETPPLLRENSENVHEESALGLPLTITEDVHLKNSGSEVTYSQFCEGAKLKEDNFRTSTQNVEADLQKIGSTIVRKLSDLPKDVLVTNKVVLSEDTSKMEPLVYCPSGSSASSAVCGSPDKGKSARDIQDSQQCSASVLHGARVITISDLNPINSDSQKVINDNTSDLSNSSSVKVISSNSSVGIGLDVLASEDRSKNRSTTKVPEVEVESGEKKDLPSDIQKDVSLSSTKSSVLLKDKESGSAHESVCISGKNLNKTITNDDIEVVSDNSSNASLLASDNNSPIKPVSSFNASSNVDNDLTVNNLEHNAKLIPKRCFYKSPTTASTLTEHELNEIYDDETSPVKYFSYCHNRDLPMLMLDVIEKIKNTNSLRMTVTFVSISPAFTDSWKERCIKARCPSCDKLYDVFNAANNRNNEDASATAAISVGSHIVCPDSQCCNQILENPEFHFSVECRLGDGTPLTALLGGDHAEEVFGCSAPEAMRNESALSRVGEILEKITKCISDKRPAKVIVKRENICNPKSGPLYIAHIGD